VQVRGLRWEIVETQPVGPQTLVRLRGVEGALLGRELDILHDFEPIEPIVQSFQPEKAAPLRHWSVYHQAFLLEQALGSGAILAVQPGRLRPEPYQLVPVLRAIRMSRPRLLLADGVGLGKTVQAGLVLTELMARRIAHRVLIVSPAGPLLEQWRMEMSERFGLRFAVVDRAFLDEVRKGNELGANPFDYIPLALASIDFLKQESVLQWLDRAAYDVVILDEAHHCTDLGNLADREDSQRRRLAELLARQSDALLLLTATPHDGNDASFASLCELLDPSLVDGRGHLRGEAYRTHVVRRLKKHIVDSATGKSRFPERQVIPCPVDYAPQRFPRFWELQRLLLDLVVPQFRYALKNRRYDEVLSFIALLKRSVSTVAACRKTLAVVAARHRALLTEAAETQDSRRQRLRTLRDYQRRLDRFGTAAADAQEEIQTIEEEDLAQALADIQRSSRAGDYRMRKLKDLSSGLAELVALASEAEAEDPKLAMLKEQIDGIRKAEPGASVLIYTEYTTSQDAVKSYLTAHGMTDILTMSGNDDDAARQQTTDRFRNEDSRILVSTDAAAEGLNLHQRCHHLIHVELPFNPNRLEQRNGRIDRYGQTHEPVVRYLYLRNTFEERILLRLIAKYERQRARLTFVPNTLGLTATAELQGMRLLEGLAKEEDWLLKEEPAQYVLFETADEGVGADDATRELLEEIDRSLHGFERAAKSNQWLADEGLYAGADQVAQADRATEKGRRESMVELVHFVTDAIHLDGGQLHGSPNQPAFAIELPPDWAHGAKDVPGYDGAARRVRLTTDPEVYRDAEGRTVGFLGRAHPLVRRALDRVRHLSLGPGGLAGTDTRVSAVSAPIAAPALLLTFLGRVLSGAGRELERVLAVRLDRGGAPQAMSDAAEWLPLAAPERALTTTGLWEQHFAGWAGDQAVHAPAVAAARAAFEPIAREFTQERRADLDRERRDLDAWLASRATALTGTTGAQFVQQDLGITETASGPGATAATWMRLTNPAERLAAFSADGTQPRSARTEAETVLRLHRKRSDDLTARLDFRAPEVIPLGVLMLVPDGQQGHRPSNPAGGTRPPGPPVEPSRIQPAGSDAAPAAPAPSNPVGESAKGSRSCDCATQSQDDGTCALHGRSARNTDQRGAASASAAEAITPCPSSREASANDSGDGDSAAAGAASPKTHSGGPGDSVPVTGHRGAGSTGGTGTTGIAPHADPARPSRAPEPGGLEGLRSSSGGSGAEPLPERRS
jgi:ERCC4-related helicase